MNTREWIIGHHTAIRHDGQPQRFRVDVSHRERGFPKSRRGWYVGYHILIEESEEAGGWVQTRDFNETGAHDVNCGCEIDLSGTDPGSLNWRGLGFCLAGNFLYDTPTEYQIRTLHALTLTIHREFNSAFLLHKETKRTACPGKDLRLMVEDYHRDHYVPDQLENIRRSLESGNPVGWRRTRMERIAARYARYLLTSPSLHV